jgi:hypothetical protein
VLVAPILGSPTGGHQAPFLPMAISEPLLKNILYASLGVVNLYTISTFALFISWRNEPTIRFRVVPLCVLMFVCTLISGNLSILQLDLFSPIFSIDCTVANVIQYLFAPLWLFGNLLRGFNLLYKSKVTDILARRKFWKPASLRPWIRKILLAFSYKAPPREVSADLVDESGKSIIPKSIEDEILLTKDIQTGIILKYCFALVLIEILLLLIAISGLSVSACSAAFGVPQYGLMFIILFVTPLVLFFIKNAKDYSGLKNEILLGSLAFLLPFFFYLVTLTLPASSPARLAPVGSSVIVVYGYLVIHTFTIVLPLFEAAKERRSKANFLKDVNSKKMDSMLEMFKKKVLYEQFRYRCQLEMSMENILFYEAYQDLQQKIDKNALTDDALKHHIIYIYEKFIAENARQKILGITYTRRRECLEQIEKENFTIQILDPVRQEVLEILYTNTFRSFVQELRGGV